MIVDASVALKWLVDETDSAIADRLLFRRDLLGPALLAAEIGSALTKDMQQGALSPAFVRAAWQEFQDCPVELRPLGEELAGALELSMQLRASFYDCVYLALAIAEDDVLVTADERFIRAVQSSSDPHIRRRAVTLGAVA